MIACVWLVLCAGLGAQFVPARDQDTQLVFAVLDVGQGSGAYVRTGLGTELVIDTGPTLQTLRALEGMRPWYDRSLDYVIASHADMDHMGIMAQMVSRYHLSKVVLGPGVRDSAAYREAYLSAHTTRRWHEGAMQVLGPYTYLRVLHPGARTYHSGNDESLVLQIVHGETRFLLTGDISRSVEEDLVERYGDSLRSDVLVVSHHGSKTSTSPLFVSTVNPRYALISLGEENSYGHPHQETLSTLAQAGVEVMRTDLEGDIVLYSNGRELLQ